VKTWVRNTVGTKSAHRGFVSMSRQIVISDADSGTESDSNGLQSPMTDEKDMSVDHLASDDSHVSVNTSQ